MQGSHTNAHPEAIHARKTNNIAKIQFKSKLSNKTLNLPSSQVNLITPVDTSPTLSTLQPISALKMASTSRSPISNSQEQKLIKLNALRNLNSHSKEEIINLKARINKLKEETQRNRKRSIQSYAQIEKMLSTKYNYIEKKRNKSLQDERRMYEQLDRIETTQLARVQNKQAIKTSREKSQLDKSTLGLTQRQISSLQSQTLKQERKRRQEINMQKAKNIKEYEKQHRNYLSIINELSRVKARSNHQEKVKSYIKQKQMLNKTMRMLREEQKSLCNSLKKQSQDLKNIEDQIQQLKLRAGKQSSPNRIS